MTKWSLRMRPLAYNEWSLNLITNLIISCFTRHSNIIHKKDYHSKQYVILNKSPM